MGATKPHTRKPEAKQGQTRSVRNKPAGPGVNLSRRILSSRELEASLVYSMLAGTRGSENRKVEDAGGQGEKGCLAKDSVLGENIRVQDKTQGWGEAQEKGIDVGPGFKSHLPWLPRHVIPFCYFVCFCLNWLNSQAWP